MKRNIHLVHHKPHLFIYLFIYLFIFYFSHELQCYGKGGLNG